MIDNTIRPSVGTEVLPTNTERDISGNNRPPLTLAILADEGDISYGYILKRDQLEQNVWQNMKELIAPVLLDTVLLISVN